MSGWGDFTNFASTALKSAQKKIDKVGDGIIFGRAPKAVGQVLEVLDIQDDEEGGAGESSTSSANASSLLSNPAVARLQVPPAITCHQSAFATPTLLFQDDFFNAFGLTGAPTSEPQDEESEPVPEAAEKAASPEPPAPKVGSFLCCVGAL